MGDAVHRHPPTNGLGSNTCVQDAFNLAWKIAYVLQGKAEPGLLESYDAERQPVGQQIVARANKSFLQNNTVWDMLGGGTRHEMAPEEHAAIFDTASGRATLRTQIDQMDYEYHAHGIEMNRRYISNAVVGDGSTTEFRRDAELFYQPGTVPGGALPHAWLATRLAGPRRSTLDLAGKGQFVLFSGHGGEPWIAAAKSVVERLGVAIKIVFIGAYLDYEDAYGTWGKLSGVDDAGCVLVRPDLIVGWRSQSLPPDPEQALASVMAPNPCLDEIGRPRDIVGFQSVPKRPSSFDPETFKLTESIVTQ